MIVDDVINFLEQIAPLSLQEAYDNSGLLVGRRSEPVKGVLICLDMTPDVLNEAIDKRCNLIIGHHPIIFKGLKKINGDNYVEQSVIKAIKSDIALYAIHTNLDNVLHNGVNEKIAQRLNLQNLKILKPRLSAEHQENLPINHIGSGIVGELPTSMKPENFLQHVKNNLGATCIKYAGSSMSSISKVAVCGGSGSQFLKDALLQGAHAFVSADFKYHEFFDAEDRILIADVGHFESEQFTIDLLFTLLINNFSNFAVQKTEINTNPVKYYL
jgi:dinuclear metal center YbgI/SA1388 family protein